MLPPTRFAIASRRVILPDGVRPAAVLVDGRTIAAVMDREQLPRDVHCEDFGDLVIAPGVIDAHVHINTFSDSAEHFAAAKAVGTELARDAVALGGTVGAEHGLGKRKAHLLEIQYSAAEIDAMRAVKRRFDPQWILGRGTLFTNP